MIYASVEDLLAIAQRVLPMEPVVREWGLLSASSVRPQTLVFGFEPYPTVPEKAAALLESLALNHCLVDGNKRLALAASFAFCEVNTGVRPHMTNDDAYDLVVGVVEHKLDVPTVALLLRQAGVPDDGPIA
jgi:death-on-curing protein